MEAPRFFTAGGIETRYYEAGAGEPLVLLHGGQYGAVSASCAEDWEPVFDGLARRFRVIALDMLGQGFTANPRTDDAYVIGSTVGHVVAFMDRLGIEKAHLAGALQRRVHGAAHGHGASRQGPHRHRRE